MSSRNSIQLKTAAENQEFGYLGTIVATQQEIATANLDLDATMSLIAERTQELTGAVGAAVELAEGDDMVYRAATGSVAPHMGLRLKVASSLSGLCVRTGEVLSCDDSETDPRVDREACRRIGVRSMIVVPLHHEGQVIGVLKVLSPSADAFSPRDVQTLRLMAGLLGSSLARSSMLSALRQEVAQRQQAEAEQGRLIGELRATLDQLRAATHRAEEATRVKSLFLASMSHELRTPLNAIIGYSELLVDEAADMGETSWIGDLTKIHSAARHLLQLINDLLDLSKVEAGKVELYPESFDLRAFIADVVETVRPLAAKTNSSVRVECPEDIGWMHADVTRVRQVLYNLLSNACKFTSDGTVTLSVGSEEGEGGSTVVFTVADTGIGMTAEQIGRLFQEFSQAHASTSKTYGGTGLGLVLTRRLCELMQGTVEVTSEPGSGSTFTVRLPRQLRLPRPPSGETAAAQDAPGDVIPEESAATAPCVLVVDDDPATVDLLTRTLAREGFRVEEARTAEAALERVRQEKPFAIVLDVMMEELRGWSLLTELKSDPVACEVPLVALTVAGDRGAGYTLGATDYLTKPFSPGALIRLLHRYVSGEEHRPILVVDDDEDTRALIRAALAARGWRVQEAANGAEALERMRAAEPALVLLDLLMPVMDGFEVIEAMRAEPAWSALPVVVVTAKDLSVEERERLGTDVQRVIQKHGEAPGDLLRRIRVRVLELAARGTGSV